jgi:hypothetical protein
LLRSLAAGALLFAGACGAEPTPDPTPPPVGRTLTAPPTSTPAEKADDGLSDPAAPASGGTVQAEIRMGSERLAFLVSSVAELNPAQSIHLYNDSDREVTIEGARLVDDDSSIFGVDGARYFHVDGLDPALPATLAPGDAMIFTLSFRPVDDLTRLATFVVRTSSDEYPELDVALLGKLYTDPTDPNF